MANPQDVRYSITAEDRFSRTFDALKRDLAASHNSMGLLATGAARTVAALGGIGAVVAGFSASAAAFKGLANDLDALNDAADATGSTVESLSALEDVARSNGGTLDLVTGAIVKMNQALNAAEPNSAVATALDRIGLSAEQLRSQDPSAAIQTLARTLAGYADDGDKARLVQELFGKSLKEAAPFLKDLADAGELNAKVTTEAAQQAEKFNKELAALQTNASNFARGIAADLLPQLNGAIEAFRQGAKEGKNWYQVIFGQQLKILGIDLEASKIKSLRADIEGLQATRERQGLDPYLQRRLAGLQSELALLEKRNKVELNSQAGGGRGVVNPELVKPSLGGPPPKPAKAAQAQQSEAERLLETLEKQLATEQKLTREEELQLAIEQKQIAGLTPALEARIRGTARFIDQLKEVNAQLERELGFQKLLADKTQRDVNEGLGLLENTPTGQRERIDRQVDLVLNVQRQNPTDDVTNQKAVEALARLRTELDELNKPLEQAKTGFEKLQDTIEKSMDKATDAVLDFAIEGKGGVGNVFKAFGRDLLRAQIEDPLRDSMKNAVDIIRKELGSLDTNNPLESIFSIFKGLAGGGGGGGGGFLDTILGFFGSTSRANGGPVKANQVVRWQENGKEWFVPGSDGTVVNPSQQRQLGGGAQQVVYSPNVVVNGDVSPQTVALVQAMLQRNNAQLVRSMRTGGAYA